MENTSVRSVLPLVQWACRVVTLVGVIGTSFLATAICKEASDFNHPDLVFLIIASGSAILFSAASWRAFRAVQLSRNDQALPQALRYFSHSVIALMIPYFVFFGFTIWELLHPGIVR